MAMIAPVLIVLQAAAVPPISYDVGGAVDRCRGANEGDIVVCGRRGKDRYRIPPLPPVNEGLGTAEREIAGVHAGAHVEQVGVGGFPSNRIMAGIKIKF